MDRRFWHAWVEIRIAVAGTDVALTMVWDHSNDREMEMPRDLYYLAGSLDETRVWRYTLTEAASLAVEHEHYGPWVDGFESLSEV